MNSREPMLNAEKILQLAIHHAPIGMALVTSDGHFLRVNPALCRMLEYNEEELLARNFQSLTHLDDLENDSEYVRQALAGEIETYEIEKRYLTQSGRVVWALLSVSLATDEDGKPLFFISQILDLTQHKRMESDLENSNALMAAFFSIRRNTSWRSRVRKWRRPAHDGQSTNSRVFRDRAGKNAWSSRQRTRSAAVNPARVGRAL